MKRKSKFTFFELKVTFYFDLYKFFIGGFYKEFDKSWHFSIIPTLFIKLESGKNLLYITPDESWDDLVDWEDVKKKYNKKPKVIKDAITDMESVMSKKAVDKVNRDVKRDLIKIKKIKK